MKVSTKSTFNARIRSVKFATNFTESSCSLVVTFPSFGSEGHGVRPPQGDSVFSYIFVVRQFFSFFFVGSFIFLYIFGPS